MITQAELKSILIYNPETGEFRWRFSGKGRDMFRPAGTITNLGYVVICIKLQRYMAHRLAWLYVYGKWPDDEIDHKDHDPQNNVIDNLREATHAENLANGRKRTDNSSGYRGVCWDKQKLKWKVQVSNNQGKRIQKHFADLDEAVQFYRETAAALFGEFLPIELA